MGMDLNIKFFQWIHAGAGTRPLVDGTAVLLAEGGPYLVAVLFVVLWFFVAKNKKIFLLEATGAIIIGLVFNQLIGFFYFHPRPYMTGLCTPLFPHGPETSFPSDHATLMFSAAFYLIFARKFAVFGLPLLAAAVLTAWARVYSGIHFPFDMAASVVVALVSVGWMRLLAECLLPFNEQLAMLIDQLTGIITRMFGLGVKR
ncbi:MAG: undecaprenyl-diphosphatase [Deltaproteobacteria bacterium]|nr:undecaprenyl-diphosphatase [Deltaproteobacteria bacterium]